MEWSRGARRVTDATEAVDFEFVERMLRSSYWAPDRPREVIEASVRGSLCFSLLEDGRRLELAVAGQGDAFQVALAELGPGGVFPPAGLRARGGRMNED